MVCGSCARQLPQVFFLRSFPEIPPFLSRAESCAGVARTSVPLSCPTFSQRTLGPIEKGVAYLTATPWAGGPPTSRVTASSSASDRFQATTKSYPFFKGRSMSKIQAASSTFAQAQSSCELNSGTACFPAIYGRGPTGHALLHQIAQLKHGAGPATEDAIVLTDSGPSTSSRPAMKQLIGLMAARRISAVYVTDLTPLDCSAKAMAEFMRQVERFNCLIVIADDAAGTNQRPRS